MNSKSFCLLLNNKLIFLSRGTRNSEFWKATLYFNFCHGKAGTDRRQIKDEFIVYLKINAIASDFKKDMMLENKNVIKIIDNIGDDIIWNRLLQMYDGKTYIEKRSKQENPDEAVIDTAISLIKK